MLKTRIPDPFESRLREDIEFIESELAKIDSPKTEYQRRLRNIYLAMLESCRDDLVSGSPVGGLVEVKRVFLTS